MFHWDPSAIAICLAACRHDLQIGHGAHYNHALPLLAEKTLINLLKGDWAYIYYLP